MKIGYHIVSKDGIIIGSNLEQRFLDRISFPKNKVESIVCPITGTKIRHGFYEVETADIYLVSYDKEITNRIFNRYFTICSILIPHFEEAENQFRKKEIQNFRRLRHNLITHNTNILQEIENAFYTTGPLKGAKAQINYIKEVIEKNPEKVAVSLLRIMKSANLIKTDFDVYDMISSKHPYLEFDQHRIHKVLISVLRPFWLDLFEKGVNINVNECNELVTIDYKTISVVFTHFFDNAVKYISYSSDLSIDFVSEGENVKIIIDMISLQITEKDLKHLFDENYSGEYADKWGKSGDGIGMFMIKKLVELNKGTVHVKTNIDLSLRQVKVGIPFEKNQFIIELRK